MDSQYYLCGLCFHIERCNLTIITHIFPSLYFLVRHSKYKSSLLVLLSFQDPLLKYTFEHFFFYLAELNLTNAQQCCHFSTVLIQFASYSVCLFFFDYCQTGDKEDSHRVSHGCNFDIIYKPTGQLFVLPSYSTLEATVTHYLEAHVVL